MSLYKYIPNQYLDDVVNDGKFLFRSLSYFQDFEDKEIRGDRYDGILKYAGEDGLEIHNLTRDKKTKEPWIFNSKVDSENIFIFSTSNKLCPELAKEFKSNICIEFKNPEIIISKLHSAVARRKYVKPNKLFHCNVKYYSENEPPGIDWHFPKKIATRKLINFNRQFEYRFVFSKNNALEFGNTTQEIEIGPKETKIRITPYPEISLKIGKIKNWCVIHEFT